MNATQKPARLTAEDRAFMLYMARKDYQRGESSYEEYREVVEGCRNQPGLFSYGLDRVRSAFRRRAETGHAHATGVATRERHAA